MAKQASRFGPSVRAGLSVAVVLMMAGFVLTVWTGLVDLRGVPGLSPQGLADPGRGPRPAAPSADGNPSVPAETTLWFTFDRRTFDSSGQQLFPDVESRWQGVEQSTGDGEIVLVPGPPTRGLAMRPPPQCALAAGCPSAVLRVADADPLDPGRADFSFGATVRLSPNEAGAGGNVVQKRWARGGGGQWTLNVDTVDGHPSCVVESYLGGHSQAIVRSPVTVADGTWHTMSCHKTAESVRIVVDGQATRLQEPIGAVKNAAPVVIGGSGLEDDEHQFHGRIDDVFLSVAAVVDEDRN